MDQLCSEYDVRSTSELLYDGEDSQRKVTAKQNFLFTNIDDNITNDYHIVRFSVAECNMGIECRLNDYS